MKGQTNTIFGFIGCKNITKSNSRYKKQHSNNYLQIYCCWDTHVRITRLCSSRQPGRDIVIYPNKIKNRVFKTWLRRHRTHRSCTRPSPSTTRISSPGSLVCVCVLFRVCGCGWDCFWMCAVCCRIFDFSFAFVSDFKVKYRLFRLKFDLFSPQIRQKK